MEYTVINGTVVDGTGKTGYQADLIVDDGAIAAMGHGLPRRGKVVDAMGKVVCPGFIDMHGHAGLLCLAEPRLEPKVRQGITTEVPGVDGYSAAPISPAQAPIWRRHLAGIEGDLPAVWDWSSFGEYRERLRGTSINWAPMVGHGNLRLAVLGMENRQATERELRQMCDLADQAFQEGAFALTTGLIYMPQAYASMDEMVALGRVVAKHGKFFDFHIRTMGAHILQAIEEVLEIGRRSGCSIQITHFQLHSRAMWGKVSQTVELIEAARREGVHVAVDQHPYTAGSTMLSALIPLWAHEGGPARLREVLQSGELRPRLERDAVEGLPPTWESRFQMAGPENICISYVRSEANQPVVGKSLAQIARDWGVSPFDAAVRLLLEEDLAVTMIVFQAQESDVEEIMRLPWQMFCTDAIMVGKPHPRAYGTYPRILARHVRDRGVLTLEEAIRKSTAVPAERLGIKDRGVLAAGKAADLVLFDPDRVADQATYENPTQYPIGIDYVFVNGRPVIWKGEHTGELPGYALG